MKCRVSGCGSDAKLVVVWKSNGYDSGRVVHYCRYHGRKWIVWGKKELEARREE